MTLVNMFSKINNDVTEKFCNFVGQSTCSTLSNYGLSVPIALTSIAALGITAATVVLWNRNATVATRENRILNGMLNGQDVLDFAFPILENTQTHLVHEFLSLAAIRNATDKKAFITTILNKAMSLSVI
ncbi:MAG: hypothetical protein JSS30_04010 [Verrucomicrobia bacterium]|nr:hypothetical protein [Verrucomicrobiota bacterium]